MKRARVLLMTDALVLGLCNGIWANDAEDSSVAADEITREEIVTERPSITRREATISMLLNAGWTMEEIDEWYTEEDLQELDENALAISDSALYTVNYENPETEEVTSVELSRQEFDYGVNQTKCAEEDHNNTELQTLSSNGVLELQPIYDWENMNGETRNDRIYYGQSGNSGASIWNADSSCYLKQNMGMVWMGDDTYQIQYRFEWKTEPYYKLTDHFAVVPATDLVVHSNPRVFFTLKGSLDGETYNILPDNLYSISNLSMGQGRQVKIKWFHADSLTIPYYLGYLRYYVSINNKYTYKEFIAYAQYYHGKLGIKPSASIGASISGPTASFSISPSWYYTTESHPMEVRAKNIYMN
ncbi:MAG: hypothetical protein HFE77_05275 [Clostridiales bacterium]|nr:hypothetical protein [Clostridiales bacterium]